MLSTDSTRLPVIQIRPSRLLRLYLFGTSLAATLILWNMTTLYWSYSLFITLFILLGVWQARLQHEKIISIKYKGDDLWILELNSRSYLKTRLLSNYYVTPWLLVMNFKSVHGKKYPVVLLKDRADKDVLRQLRVLLQQMKI